MWEISFIDSACMLSTLICKQCRPYTFCGVFTDVPVFSLMVGTWSYWWRRPVGRPHCEIISECSAFELFLSSMFVPDD